MQETRVQSLGREDLLEKEMATHSSILAWKIPRRVEPGRLQSIGSQSWIQLSSFTFTHILLSHLIIFINLVALLLSCKSSLSVSSI